MVIKKKEIESKKDLNNTENIISNTEILNIEPTLQIHRITNIGNKE